MLISNLAICTTHFSAITFLLLLQLEISFIRTISSSLTVAENFHIFLKDGSSFSMPNSMSFKSTLATIFNGFKCPSPPLSLHLLSSKLISLSPDLHETSSKLISILEELLDDIADLVGVLLSPNKEPLLSRSSSLLLMSSSHKRSRYSSFKSTGSALLSLGSISGNDMPMSSDVLLF